VGVEGLKVEPLASHSARRQAPRPEAGQGHLRDRGAALGASHHRLRRRGRVRDHRPLDKNFLDVNYILLMRRKKFRLLDGVRFGGTLTIEDAWELGFHHVAFAVGAGRPTFVPMKNNMARGIRMASDFLMRCRARAPTAATRSPICRWSCRRW